MSVVRDQRPLRFEKAAILLYRSDEILKEDCDMASVHCLLSTLPDHLPFEELLKTSNKLMKKYSLTVVEQDVENIIYQEKKQRQAEENMVIERRQKISGPVTANKISTISEWFPNMFTSKSVILTTAVSIIVGVCAYYYKNQYLAAGIS
ncbi:uncharacterized protein LOC108024076 isoform X3 [Drosophila biarmipes]|uniref:uncharacterized protein LOC108024076 isoform X3 n=1 Tax=Drosophila biarmipes TaxID=125945 RepID=UPI0007E7F45A|nr:uncharacterized protein LOC108024076 isoform X3 [Drosophila biarmipes]